MQVSNSDSSDSSSDSGRSPKKRRKEKREHTQKRHKGDKDAHSPRIHKRHREKKHKRHREKRHTKKDARSPRSVDKDDKSPRSVMADTKSGTFCPQKSRVVMESEAVAERRLAAAKHCAEQRETASVYQAVVVVRYRKLEASPTWCISRPMPMPCARF